MEYKITGIPCPTLTCSYLPTVKVNSRLTIPSHRYQMTVKPDRHPWAFGRRTTACYLPSATLLETSPFKVRRW